MYIKKQKELKTFLPTFIISFCRFNIRILSFGQFLSYASTILSFSELWRHFVLWSQSCDCDCDHRHCDHNPQNAIQAFMFSLAGIPLSLWSSAFHQLEVAGVTKRCQKSVQWHIFDSTEHIVTWQMWQCAIKWQSDIFFSQSCDNLDMTRDFHPSLAKLSPQSLLKHPWTIKKGKAPNILEKPYFCPLFYFCWWERMCGGNWIGLIGACLTFSRCHIFRFIWYKITA